MLLLVLYGGTENTVIRFLLDKSLQHFRRIRVGDENGNFSASFSQRQAAIDKGIAGKAVQEANEFPGVIMYGITAFFELIDFLKHGYWDEDIIFFKMKNAIRVV